MAKPKKEKRIKGWAIISDKGLLVESGDVQVFLTKKSAIQRLKFIAPSKDWNLKIRKAEIIIKDK